MLFGGYGYSYQSSNTPSSPPRTGVWGSAYSPFRNSASMIQNGMDQTISPVNGTNARSVKSPAGGAGNAPGIGAGGRTMKDYEDQLEALKKENFNLKLRIYFMEERMVPSSVDDDPVRKNIELKVENNTLKKELMEKQDLLSQAAKAFELIEQQKDASSRNQAQYQESLEIERRKIAELEMVLEDYKGKLSDTSMYYQETFGITPEKALEHQEKLNQMEEVVASLEAEVKQITESLAEERTWAQELEIERDQFRNRLEAETRLREKLSNERDDDIETLRKRIKELEDEAFKRESVVQQQKNEITEKDRLLKDKALLLEETSRTCEEVSAVAEKRKTQIVQLRLSVKSRDDALTELNNKHRALLNQFEQNYVKRSSAPSSPQTSTPFNGSQSPKSEQKSSQSPFDWDPNSSNSIEIRVLAKEIEERDREIKRQEEARKQLILKLCNAQKTTKATEEQYLTLESEHQKALKMIQDLMVLQQKYEDKHIKKDRKIAELEMGLEKMYKNSEAMKFKRSNSTSSDRKHLSSDNHPDRDPTDKYEQIYVKRSSAPSTPLMCQPLNGSESSNSGQKSSQNEFNCDQPQDRSQTYQSSSSKAKSSDSINILSKEIEDRDREIKRQEAAKKQLILKLCNAEKSAKDTEEKYIFLENEYQKAVKTIQGFMVIKQKLEDKQLKRDRKITELEMELEKIYKSSEGVKTKRSSATSSSRKEHSSDNHPEHDQTDKQRFEDMECKINELRDQIESVKAEKNLLEIQIAADSEVLEDEIQVKEEKIDNLETEKCRMRQELWDKMQQLDELQEAYDTATEKIQKLELQDIAGEQHRLRDELILRNIEIEDKNRKIEQLSKDLQVKTQNLQKLVNTELWSKNKEIAKLHNQTVSAQDTSRGNKSEITQQEERATSQLEVLLKELNDIGISVTFTSDIVQLNHVNGNESIDVKTMTEYVRKLVNQKRELEREVDYLRWLKLVAQPDIASPQDLDRSPITEIERARKYCEMLRKHVKDLFKFMKEMLKTQYPESIGNDHKKIILDVLLSSKTLYDDFVRAQEGAMMWEQMIENGTKARRSLSTELGQIDGARKPAVSEAQSDSETFSEPDRKVSLARIGLQETHKNHKSSNRPRVSKFTKTFSDSEDSIDYLPYHKSGYQNEGDIDAAQQIHQLTETNRLLGTELRALREEIASKVSLENGIEEKFAPILVKLEKSQRLNDRLQSSLERRIHEWNALKIDSKNNSVRKAQLEKKITDVEIMAVEIAKQKTDLLNYKEDTERKAAEMLITLNRENETLRSRIKLLEEENEVTRSSVSTLSKELDQLTLSHSQVLVENTKLTNDKLRLEQDVRKSESKYEMTVRSLQEKFNKEVTDLNQMNDSHRSRLEELESVNKELRRHVVVCEASDSAPSSSGVSSIPADANHKQTCDDLFQEYQTYNGSQYWLSLNYPTFTGRSKSSCSPDLGIESDAAVSTTRPLQDTLKITESMTNLLSDEDYNSNTHRSIRDIDRDSPLHLEGLDEVEALKQENEALKRRLMKTRRALEDTFQHLSASNKNKKNVEKAITKQLMMTKSILKKTRTYEEPFD